MEAGEGTALKLPRTITHILITKDRYGYEFCNKRTLKPIVLEWTAAGKKFDVYELQAKTVSAKVDIT